MSKQCAAALILHVCNALSNRSQSWLSARSWVFCIDCAAKRVTVAMLGIGKDGVGSVVVVGPMWMTLQGSHAKNTGR